MKRNKEGKEEESEENQSDVTVKEVDLGDGTRKMLKFEKKEEKLENKETKSDETAENKEQEKKEEKSPPSGEPKREEPSKTMQMESAPTQVSTPMMEKQLAKFEMEIAKNREMIKNLEEKIENINRDLDDLVSLYEIVSEQMNPFVGLSKVTKKRLEALEKIYDEFDEIKSRLEDLEVFVGKMPAVDTKNSPTEMTGEKNADRPEDKMETTSPESIVEREIELLIEKFLEEIKNE